MLSRQNSLLLFAGAGYEALLRIRRRLEFLLPARGFASRGADAAGGASRAWRPRAVRPQFSRRRGARASDQARAGADARLSSRRAPRLLPTARPTSSPIRATAPAGGGSAACSRAATCAPRRATCILYLDDLLDHIDGLELIVMERSTWDLPTLPWLRNKPMSRARNNGPVLPQPSLWRPSPAEGQGGGMHEFERLTPSPTLPRKRGREHTTASGDSSTRRETVDRRLDRGKSKTATGGKQE